MSEHSTLKEVSELVSEQIIPLLVSAAKEQPRGSKAAPCVSFPELLSVLQEANEGGHARSWTHHYDGD